MPASLPKAVERFRLLTSFPRLLDAAGSLLALAHSPEQSPGSHHLPRRPSLPIQASQSAALSPPADQNSPPVVSRYGCLGFYDGPAHRPTDPRLSDIFSGPTISSCNRLTSSPFAVKVAYHFAEIDMQVKSGPNIVGSEVGIVC